MRRIVAALMFAAGLCASAFAQTPLPFYVDNSSSSAVIPRSFNGNTWTGGTPESWDMTALVVVQYDGTTTLNLNGQNVITSGSGRVPRPGHAITTITATGFFVATPTLLSSVAGAAPFTVYFDAAGNAYTDQGLKTLLTYDVYGNPIDPSSATFNADGTVATAGTAYVQCPTCANLEFNPPYQMPCLSDGNTVDAVDCQRNPDPNLYYGPPITAWVHVCAEPQTHNADGSLASEQYQACAPTYRDPNTQTGPSTYDSPAYTAGDPAVDTSGNPVTLTCTQVQTGTYGGKPLLTTECSWSGTVATGAYFLRGMGASSAGYNSAGAGGSVVFFPVTVPNPPAAPAPTCPPTCGDERLSR